jgi:hypothetical protein
MIASDWKCNEPASIVSHMSDPLAPHRVIALCALPNVVVLVKNCAALDIQRVFVYMTLQGCCDTESVHKHDLTLSSAWRPL